MTGDKIYDGDLDVTGVTDFGVTLQATLTGQAKIPPQGARIDSGFDGRASGRLTGIWGVRTINFVPGKVHIDAYMHYAGG
jgi:hypothetical protein